MSEGIELPPIDVTKEDLDLAKDLFPGNDLAIGYFANQCCLQRQIINAMKRIAELEQLMALPDENDPLCAKIVDSATFDPERQEAKAGGTIGDWMRRAKAAEAKLAAQSSPQAQGFEEWLATTEFCYLLQTPKHPWLAEWKRVWTAAQSQPVAEIPQLVSDELLKVIMRAWVEGCDLWRLAKELQQYRQRFGKKEQ